MNKAPRPQPHPVQGSPCSCNPFKRCSSCEHLEHPKNNPGCLIHAFLTASQRRAVPHQMHVASSLPLLFPGEGRRNSPSGLCLFKTRSHVPDSSLAVSHKQGEQKAAARLGPVSPQPPHKAPFLGCERRRQSRDATVGARTQRFILTGGSRRALRREEDAQSSWI